MRLSRCDSSILAIKCGTGEGDKKRVSRCVALEMGHRAGVVPGIEANPMWVLKSKSPNKGIFQFSPNENEVFALLRHRRQLISPPLAKRQ